MPGRVSLLIALATLAGCAPPSLGPPQRIILVSMDTVRASEVNGYGGNSTPVLAEIARAGVLFSDAYASSTFTIPSHMSMFTGLHPLEHGVKDDKTGLAESVPTLAEALRRAGYRTQAFHEGGYVSSRYGFDRGFDAYDELPRVAVVREGLPQILEWMHAQDERPYFLFLHTYAAHNPYGGYDEYRALRPELDLPTRADLISALDEQQTTPLDRDTRAQLLLFNQLCDARADRLAGVELLLPPGFDETPEAEKYLEAIQWAYRRRIRGIDAAIGQLRDTLLELDQWQDTLLIVTSDHGEAFFEHGLSWHGDVPFNEVLRIPLILSYPRVLAHASRRVERSPVSHLDLLPTILGFAQIPHPRNAGTDLRHIMDAAGTATVHRPIFTVVQEVPFKPEAPAREVVIDGRYKLVESRTRLAEAPGLLFDLETDPGEERNLFEERPDVRARLLSSLETRRESQRTANPTLRDSPPLSPGDDEKLQALGYAR